MEKVTQENVNQLIQEGYTVIRNVVAPELIQQAKRAINCRIGKGVSEAEAESIVNGVCFPELMVKPAITHLFSISDAGKIARGILGQVHHVPAGQIALRFPGWGCNDKVSFTPSPFWNKGWHIDGVPDVTKPDHKKGQIGTFSCLLGVVLQDITGPFCGNLVVYPGSHAILADHFRQHPEALTRMEQEGDKVFPKLAFPPAKQVTARAGDITLCHYMLAHNVAANSSPDVRYLVYFRLHTKEHVPGTYRRETLTNLWGDWRGLKEEDIRRNSIPVPYSATAKVEQGLEGLTLQQKGSADLLKYSRLAEEADAFFEKQKWGDAFRPYQELAENYVDDWIYQFRAGFCAAMAYSFTFFEKSKAALGEKAIRRSIALFPDFIGGYAVLQRILVSGGRHKEVLENFEHSLSYPHYPPEYLWAADLAVDALRSAKEALNGLRRASEFPSWRDGFLAVYPELKDKAAQI